MENNKISYIKTDSGIIINEKCIRLVKKMDECLAVCLKQNGCRINDTHKICKLNNLESYLYLNKNF